ncbi:hypothetical protein STRCI_005309 [Streptomyces cinnabarinus]|uniref:Uncharacterized protein n=1 Tax=Streptomyces cinnabarinus TaxID=67287 RepID=A0ABY7KMK6_9ACTN|nr:hypothetical protein [Streptomyces cinnabarinus]WAZ23936.1 hypothetical protein STRCI_005309 [Streptomyces cinnabarinus]
MIIDYPEQFEADPEVRRPFQEAIAAWQETENSFAVGALAFGFWGRPPFSDDFRARFGQRLGHRTVEHMGKF